MRVERPEFDPARIVVLPHAVEQARRRTDMTGTDEKVRAAIVFRLTEGIRNGSVFDQRPKAFRRPGERKGRLRVGQRLVVWGECGFVIDIGRVPEITVVTTYNPLR